MTCLSTCEVETKRYNVTESDLHPVPENNKRVSRRSVLAGTGFVGTSIVAGCLDSGGDGTDNQGDQANGDQGQVTDSGSGDQSTNAAVSLRIGGLYPLSGPASAIGNYYQTGAELALDRLKEDEIEIDYIPKDTEFDVETGLRRARELIEEDTVDVLIGGANSAAASAIQEEASRNEVPFMITGADADSLTNEDCNEYTFRSAMGSYQSQSAQAEDIMQTIGKRYATVGSDRSWPRESLAVVNEVAQDNGGELVEEFWPAPGTDDYSAIIEQLGNLDIDVFFMRIVGASAIRFYNQVSEFNLETTIAGPGVMTTLLGVGDDLIGNYGYGWGVWEEDTPEKRRFVNDYLEISDGQVPAIWSVGTYIGMRLVSKAAVESGTDSNAMINGLEGLEWDEPEEVRIRPCDHQAELSPGNYEIVAPDEHPSDFVQEFDPDFPVRKEVTRVPIGEDLRPCEEKECGI
jgi:branched-chain amino acid transport system substrate-binding protein